MKRYFLLMALLAGLGIVLAGCSTSTEPAKTDTSSLEDFGPYTATDEPGADFGDPALNESLNETEETVYQDPVALSPLVDSIENDGSTAIYCFRMVWGNLPRDTGITELTDWSGNLTISRGAIVVTHLIKFEPGQDSLLPRYDQGGFYIPEELNWVSFTSIGVDGIATRLYVPPSITDDVVTVSYHSEQLDINFTVYDLESLDTLIEVGPGNSIMFQSVLCEPKAERPTHGILAGYWGRDDDGQGIFYGRWMSSRGRLIGTIMGEWGIDSTGNSFFLGKYVDTSGRFEGFVKGNWWDMSVCASGDCPPRGGVFKGRIFDGDRQAIGILKGHFMMGSPRPGGYFAGQWCVGERCMSDRP